MNTWRIISATLLKTAENLGRAWQQRLPSRGGLPSPAQDALCDHWCQELAADLHATIEPPVDIRPWVLVRLVAMAEKAEELSHAGETGPPPLTESTLRMFLIHEWHRRLSHVWKQKRELPSVAA